MTAAFGFDEKRNVCILSDGLITIEIESNFVFEMLVALIFELSPRFPLLFLSLDAYRDTVEEQLLALMSDHLGIKESDIETRLRVSQKRETTIDIEREPKQLGPSDEWRSDKILMRITQK